MEVKKELYLYYYAFVLLTFANIAMLVIRIEQGQMMLYDIYGRWQESAYLVHGIYPYDATKTSIIASIGRIDPYMVTVPWAWLLGMVINPGFLPYQTVKIYAAVICIITILISSYVGMKYLLNKHIIEKTDNTEWFFMIFFMICAQYAWTWAIMMGNQGAIVCCFIFLAVLIYKKHPIIAGTLLTFAMVKPQLAVIFVFTFLVLKEFRVFFTTLILGVLSYLSVLLLTGKSFLEPLIDTMNAGTSLGAVFFGLFDPLKNFGVSVNAILIMDVITGICYIYWYLRRCKKNGFDDSISLFTGVAIASMFWFYKQPHDYIIVIIPAFLLLSRWKTFRSPKEFRINLIIALSLILIFYVQTILKKMIGITLDLSEQTAKEFVMTISSFYYMWIGYFCSIKKYDELFKK